MDQRTENSTEGASQLQEERIKDDTKCTSDAVAIDCEMVGLGPKGSIQSLARVSIVDESGTILLDKYVQQRQKVTSYRTKYSGILPHHLRNGETFKKVRNTVKRLINQKKLIGHAIENEFKVLDLTHPAELVRDTQKYKGFHDLLEKKTPSLKDLTFALSGEVIQKRQHCSVEDARATMKAYLFAREKWEADLKENPSQIMFQPIASRKKSFNKRKQFKKNENATEDNHSKSTTPVSSKRYLVKTAKKRRKRMNQRMRCGLGPLPNKTGPNSEPHGNNNNVTPSNTSRENQPNRGKKRTNEHLETNEKKLSNRERKRRRAASSQGE